MIAINEYNDIKIIQYQLTYFINWNNPCMLFQKKHTIYIRRKAVKHFFIKNQTFRLFDQTYTFTWIARSNFSLPSNCFCGYICSSFSSFRSTFPICVVLIFSQDICYASKATARAEHNRELQTEPSAVPNKQQAPSQRNDNSHHTSGMRRLRHNNKCMTGAMFSPFSYHWQSDRIHLKALFLFFSGSKCNLSLGSVLFWLVLFVIRIPLL